MKTLVAYFSAEGTTAQVASEAASVYRPTIEKEV